MVIGEGRGFEAGVIGCFLNSRDGLIGDEELVHERKRQYQLFDSASASLMPMNCHIRAMTGS